jgi:hypothetical protein
MKDLDDLKTRIAEEIKIIRKKHCVILNSIYELRPYEKELSILLYKIKKIFD